MDPSLPGLPVHHQLPEFTQTHVHRVGDAIQPSHPLSSPSPPAFNLSQHQGLCKCARIKDDTHRPPPTSGSAGHLTSCLHPREAPDGHNTFRPAECHTERLEPPPSLVCMWTGVQLCVLSD